MLYAIAFIFTLGYVSLHIIFWYPKVLPCLLCSLIRMSAGISLLRCFVTCAIQSFFFPFQISLSEILFISNSNTWYSLELKTVYRSGYAGNYFRELDRFLNLWIIFLSDELCEVSKIMKATPCATTLDLRNRWTDAFWPNTYDTELAGHRNKCMRQLLLHSIIV